VTVALAPIAPRWELYRLLSEPARLCLLALAAEDELAVSELAELLDESQPNVSRQAAPLRQAGLLTVRRQGTWTLMRLAPDATHDPVVADALRAGRALCEERGTLGRVADVVRARERTTREFFARPRSTGAAGSAPESTAYLAALAELIPERALAVDAGTGDGRSLDLLAPLFEHVIAIDRSEAQLASCRERVRLRGFENVELLLGEIDEPNVQQAVLARGGADVVLAARVLHHAPRPADAMRNLARLARAGGAVIVLDYERHEDESMREREADLWLGFEPSELRTLADGAGLVGASVRAIPPPWCGAGPDRHLQWQVLLARRPSVARENTITPVSVTATHRRAGRTGASQS